MTLVVKNPPANAREKETQIQSLGQEDSMEEGMATHSSVLARRIPWTEEPGGLQPKGLQRVRHDLARTHTSLPGTVFCQCFSFELAMFPVSLFAL